MTQEPEPGQAAETRTPASLTGNPPDPEKPAGSEKPAATAKAAEAPAETKPGASAEPARKKREGWAAVFMPNRAVSASTFRLLVLVQAALAFLLWFRSPFEALPRPGETLDALRRLWFEQGLAHELFTSLKLNVHALALSTLLSLGLAYLTVLPVFRPVAAALTKGRFLSLAGFTFLFTLLVGGGYPLKLSLLVFGMSVFYLTSMTAEVEAIPKADYDHARTLRMSEWRVVWEVVVLGTFHKAWEVLRQNAAIGWMMLTMVEGISRSEGGIGAMLLNQNKHFRLPEVFAIQLLILVVGLGQDYLIGVLRRLCCPYADLTLERRA
jgi:NitT/TauT family transport system permease protein